MNRLRHLGYRDDSTENTLWYLFPLVFLGTAGGQDEIEIGKQVHQRRSSSQKVIDNIYCFHAISPILNFQTSCLITVWKFSIFFCSIQLNRRRSSTHRAFVDCYMLGTGPLELSGVSVDLRSVTRAWLLQLRETPKCLELFLSFLPVTTLNDIKWRWKRSRHTNHEQLSGWKETKMKQDRRCTYNVILWRVPAIVIPPRLS